MSAEHEEELVMVDSPTREREPEVDAPDSDDSTDDEDEEEVSVKKRFEEIIRLLKNDELDLSTPAKLEAFTSHNANYLGRKTLGDGDHNTLLHLLVDDAKDKVFDKYQLLVKLLIDHYSQTLAEKDGNEKTALYIAIYKKRNKLVRFICKNYKNVASVIKIACYHSENCLHVALRRNVAPELAVTLIKYADDEALQAKDDKGNTPLHLAVAYDRCTDKQLEVVEALVTQCDKAMDQRTNADIPLSPYQYHEYTRIESRKATENEARKAVIEREKKVTPAAPGKNEDGSTDGHVGPGKDLKKPTVQVMDSKVGKAGMAAIDVFKPRSLRRTATGSEAPYGTRSTATASDGDPHKLGLNIPPGYSVSNDGKPSNPKTPLAAKAEKKKKPKEPKEEPKVTEESAAVIRNYLKLHCMRNMNHDDAVDFLYGRNQGEKSCLTVRTQSC